MKNTYKRTLAVILAVLLILSVLPQGTAFAGSPDGYFYLMAATDSKMIISPVRVGYTKGMSIREALINSPYEFEGIADGGYISTIEGYSASFSLFYDGGEFALDEDASEITAIAFMEKGEYYSEELISLIVLMGEYSGMTNNVKNYPEAKKIYENALDEMRSPSAETAKKTYDALSKAIKDYENIIGGEKYDVTFNVTKGPDSVSEVKLVLTDEYGNVTNPDSAKASVHAGEYSFVISDKTFSRAEGRVEIKGDATFDIALADKEWFGDINILDADKKPYEHTQDKENHTAKYFIPDTAGKNDLYLNAGMGEIPDEDKTKVYAVYSRWDTGLDKSDSAMSWEAINASLAGLLKEGMEGITIPLEARYDTGSYTQIQSYSLEFVRVPTLLSLGVYEAQTQVLNGFSPTENEYDLSVLADTLTVKTETFGDSYKVTVDGKETDTIDLTGKTSHKAEITVIAGEAKNTYTLDIKKVNSAKVTLKAESGVDVTVLNSTGSEVKSEGNNVYRLVSGETYTYVATKDKYYHTKRSFTAKDGLTVTAMTPEVKDALKDFTAYNNSASATNKKELLTDKDFTPDVHEYVMFISDSISSVYPTADVDSKYIAYAEYNKQHPSSKLSDGQHVRVEIKNKNLTNCVAVSGYSQDLVISLERISAGVTYYQEYLFKIKRELNLASLSPTDEGVLFMNEKNTEKVAFDYQNRDYYVFLPAGTETLSLSGKFPNEDNITSCCGGYYAVIGDEKYEDLSEITLALSADAQKEDIVITVCHADESSIQGKYTIHITQQEPVDVTFATVPEDAIVYVKNNITGKRIPEINGKFSLNPGSVYTYTVTKNGYIGKTEKNYVAPTEDSVVSISLQKAPESGLKIFDSWWSSFRADKLNNGIISGKTPTTSEDTVLYWATKIGSGFDKNACGCPIIVDGYLYTYAGTTIYKVDTVSGEIIDKGEMDHASSFAVNPPTYADGMIFVGLAEGCVQAFSAETLESLWLYRDELGGQPNCTIYYHDGYIYTGFWRGENVEANYVCLSVTDEDKTQDKENKIPTWTYTSKGGFYWAGAYVNDNFAIIGTDDGEGGYMTGKAKVVTFSTKTGEVIDSITMPYPGDIRSSIVYDKENDEYYFTSKGGYFYGLRVDKNGNIRDDSLRYIRLANGGTAPTQVPMSTSSPAVYNHRAYIGVSGTSQFGPYTGHNITVLDLKNWEIAYVVPTQGYPQTSGIVSTAYEAEKECVYVYFIDNYTPGKLRVLSDTPNQTKPDTLIIETYSKGGKDYEAEVGNTLFTPDGEQAQYAICSPIVDEYGTIYFKNDSAYLMAVGSTIEKIEITEKPAKLSYKEGEKFDPAGMKVTATYSNGLTRDVTEYVTFSTEELTADDTSFQIRYEKVKYQDKDGNAGSVYTAPIAFIDLDIIPDMDPAVMKACDIDGNGNVNSDDLSIVLMNYTLRENGDVNSDGTVDSADISIILSCFGRFVAE